MADEKKENAIARYVRETTGEIKKVNWPTWPEARQLTLIVIAVMVVMGIYLSIADALGAWLISFALGVN